MPYWQAPGFEPREGHEGPASHRTVRWPLAVTWPAAARQRVGSPSEFPLPRPSIRIVRRSPMNITPHPRRHPIDALLSQVATALDAGDAQALADLSASMTPDDRAALLARLTGELTRRAFGADFTDDDMPTDFRVTLYAGPGPNVTGVVIRIMHIDRDATGAETDREIEAQDWEMLADGVSETLDPATADAWLTEAGYLRTTDWDGPQTTKSGRTLYRADAIHAIR